LTIADLLRSAFSNLRRRKLRSFLTIFAVVIGAGLVSLLVSLGIGAQEFLTAQIRATMPPDVLIVGSNPNAFQIGFGGMGFGGSPQELSEDESSPYSLSPLTLEEIDSVRNLEHVERVDPYIMVSADSVRLQNSEKRFRAQLSALPDYIIRNKELVAGQYLDDYSQGGCIIANQYLESFGLEQAEDAVGQELVIQVGQMTSFIGLPTKTKDYNFEIVGVAEKTLSSTQVMISLTDGKEIARFWANAPDLYTDEIPPALLQVKVEDSQYAEQVAGAIEGYELGALTSADVLGLVGNIFGIIQAVLSVFGLIALGVASLGIINTLIMAIYERTREIGVMKAVGASQRTIRLLFTIEGGVIGLLGGIIGVAIAYGLGFIINHVSHTTFLEDFETFDISLFPWWLVAGVIALSTLIALLAALYPAHRASKLNPIDALRYE